MAAKKLTIEQQFERDLRGDSPTPPKSARRKSVPASRRPKLPAGLSYHPTPQGLKYRIRIRSEKKLKALGLKEPLDEIYSDISAAEKRLHDLKYKPSAIRDANLKRLIKESSDLIKTVTIEALCDEHYEKYYSQLKGSKEQEHPKRLGINSLWRKAGDLSQKEKSELLHAEVLEAIKNRQITSRADLLEFLEEGLGLTVTRATEKTVSVKFPGSPRAIKLKGAIYEAQTQHQSLKTAVGQGTLIPEEYGQAKLRLNLLLSQRAQNITNAHTTTRRRNVYGQRRTEISGTRAKQAHCRTGGTPWRKAHHLERKNSLERGVFQARGGVRLDSHDGGHQKAVQGLWSAPSEPQQAFVKSEQIGGATGQSRPRWGQSAPAINPAADLDEQIRALSLQLNDCPVGSLESRAITDQLNWLQGEKGRLPKEPVKVPKLKR